MEVERKLVCFACGSKFGKECLPDIYPVVAGQCCVCGESKAVTTEEAFGGLKPAWKRARRKPFGFDTLRDKAKKLRALG
jgi:hypothetical protein